MSISELGSLGEFISSIVVVVTLVYLAFQLRQNTRSTRSQSRYFVLEALNADLKELTEPTFFEKAQRAFGEDATPQEILAHSMHINGWLSHLEMLYLEIRDGTLPQEFEDTLRWRLSALFVTAEARARDYWKTWQGYFTSGFQQYVDELLEQDLEAIFATTKHY